MVLTDTLPNGINPLKGQRAAAVWAAVQPVVPAFSASFNVIGDRKPIKVENA